MKQNVLVIDLDRCIGCRGGCQVACKTQNTIALGASRSKLYTMGPTGTYPDLEMYFIPVMCQQCEDAPCARVCPTDACYKSDEDGVVYIDREVCIGCQTCMKACPYQAIVFNKELRVADKCDICPELRVEGKRPACARNCSGAAIHFGDINDPDSEVSKLLRDAGEENVHSLAAKNCKPSARYILRNAEWLDTPPHEFSEQGGERDE